MEREKERKVFVFEEGVYTTRNFIQINLHKKKQKPRDLRETTTASKIVTKDLFLRFFFYLKSRGLPAGR